MTVVQLRIAQSPSASAGLPDQGESRDVAFHSLDVCPLNPRHHIDKDELQQLKAAVKAKGILQPIIVRPAADRFEVVVGKRRHLVLAELIHDGIITADFLVPCRVRHLSDREVIEIGVMENDIRASMTTLESAEATADLASRGLDPNAIADMFGYEPRRVRGNIAIGRLIEPARELLRTGIRSLDWAKVMTLAPVEMQDEICIEIAENDSRLVHPWEIRRRIESGALLARHAFFDISEYLNAGGQIIDDLFNTVDNGAAVLTNRRLFWQLQDSVIDETADRLKSEGWAQVEIFRDTQPRLQAYARTDTPGEGLYIIAVNGKTGQVDVHKGLVQPVDLTSNQSGSPTAVSNGTPTTGSINDGCDVPAPTADSDEEQVDLEEAIAAQVNNPAVPDPTFDTPTTKQASYAAAHRTAIIQNAVARHSRLAMAVAIVALDNHPDTTITSQPYHFAAPADHLTGAAFQALADLAASRTSEAATATLDAVERRHEHSLAHLLALDSATLKTLFSRTVASRIGQSATGLDNAPLSLLNQLASAMRIDTRDKWQPDTAFFELYQGEQLRALCRSLLPTEHRTGIEGASRKSLARRLADCFDQAKAGRFDAATNDRLNTWRPVMMNFPATASDMPK